jgi:hypothetical protein
MQIARMRCAGAIFWEVVGKQREAERGWWVWGSYIRLGGEPSRRADVRVYLLNRRICTIETSGRRPIGGEM